MEVYQWKRRWAEKMLTGVLCNSMQRYFGAKIRGELKICKCSMGQSPTVSASLV